MTLRLIVAALFGLNVVMAIYGGPVAPLNAFAAAFMLYAGVVR